jgi:hypothetical protein
MKNYLFIILIITLSYNLNCATIPDKSLNTSNDSGETQINFIDNLYQKKVISFSDGIAVFCYFTKVDVKNDFEENVKSLKNVFKYFPVKYSKDKNFTVGDFSLFAIQYLKIKSGIFYLATKNGRYASRELIIRNIIPFNTSELNVLSGEQLLSYLQKVVEYEENNNKK